MMALAGIISESPSASASSPARTTVVVTLTLQHSCTFSRVAPRTSHHAAGLVLLLLFPFSSPLLLHIVFALTSGPHLFPFIPFMKLLTRVKPKPVTTAISAVRRFPPSLAPANISGVPQYTISLSRPPAREFVSPFPGPSSVCSSNNRDTRERDEDVGLWSWANPSDSYNHSHNHIRQREDGHPGRDPRLVRKIGLFLPSPTATFRF
jgi:hypothetical protein